MVKRLPQNRNLHIQTEPTFRGLGYYPHGVPVHQYLHITHQVMQHAIHEHPRTLAIRVDLRYPRYYQHEWNSAVMARFFDKFQYLLNNDYLERLNRGVKAYSTSLRYVWCRETTEDSPCHYHVMLFLNRDAYYKLGDFNNLQQGLAGMIRLAWASALKVDVTEPLGAVHFPENPTYKLDAYSPSFQQDFQDVFYRASYFAKAETKQWGDRTRSFGSSRK